MRISDWSSDVCSSDLPGAGTLVANTWINRRVRVEADTFSAFGQLNWRPISDVTVQLGGRLSYSKIQGSKILTVEPIGGGALTDAQVTAPLEIGRASGRERAC